MRQKNEIPDCHVDPPKSGALVMRRILKAAVLFLAAVSPTLVHAKGPDGYPNRPVKVLVPFAPGGVVDVMGRLLAAKLSEQLGENFYIENHGGAGGNIGTGMAARAAPDGYTILINSSSFIVNPSLNAQVPYDPVKSFDSVTIAAASPNLLLVNPDFPAKTLKEFVALVKAKPQEYSYASAGVGTTPHLSGELFRLSQGLDIVHVPFTGAGPALQATIGNHTPVAFAALPPSVSIVQNGQLRALAVTSAQRSMALPDVPTMQEQGFSGQEAETLLFVCVPAGTPKTLVNFLNEAIVKVIAMPDVREKLRVLGFNPVANSPAAADEMTKSETAKWAKVIADAHIKTQ
jgi:tripartite-type tricarboxylate transporter receptor subunit TctC